MKAFILAAGEGTRIRPLTANTPKPLLLCAGKPFLQHTLEALNNAGIKEVLLLVGYKGKRIEEYFGNGKNLGIKISYTTQEKRLGTAHAIGMGKDILNDDFICINGDVISQAPVIKDLIKMAKKTKGHVMTLTKVSNPRDYGVITLKGDLIMKIQEKPSKPATNLANAGIYFFKKEIFDYIAKTGKSTRGEYEITETQQMLMNEKKLHGLVSQHPWIDIGKPWDLLAANKMMMENLKTRINGKVEDGVHYTGPLVVEKGAIVKSGTYIEGPCIICKDAVIGPNSYLRGSTTIGPNTKIGAASEVKNSIVMDGTNIPHHNYVGDSIIGCNCNLGSGTKVANLRLDEKNIKVVLKGKYIDTGRRKLGVIMGDNVKTGINASIDVGTIIGENSFLGPSSIARGSYSANSKIT